jgi:hypothetical protein
VGANHQTGWTGLIAKSLEDLGTNHSRRIADALMPEKLTASGRPTGTSMKRQADHVGAGQPT